MVAALGGGVERARHVTVQKHGGGSSKRGAQNLLRRRSYSQQRRLTQRLNLEDSEENYLAADDRRT